MSDIGTGATTQEPLDRKDVLREQFDQVEQKATTETVVPSDDGKVTDEESKDRFSPHFGKPAGRPRDERGQFLPGKPPVVAGPGQPPADQPVAQSTDPWAAAPPPSWKPHMRDGWSKLDPTVQKYVYDREQEMRAGVEPLLPKAQLADRLTAMAAPYMPVLQGLGIDPFTAVEGLMRLDNQLRTLPFQQKMQVLNETLREYGIDLSGTMQQATPAYDAQTQAMRNEQLALNAKVAALAQETETFKQMAALDQIEMFKRTQSPEHFDDVKELMADLLDKGMAKGIDDAYEKALRLTPEIFDKMQSGKQAAADAEKRRLADEAAKRARAAAVSPRSATPGMSTTTNAKDRRSTIRDLVEGLSERL